MTATQRTALSKFIRTARTSALISWVVDPDLFVRALQRADVDLHGAALREVIALLADEIDHRVPVPT